MCVCDGTFKRLEDVSNSTEVRKRLASRWMREWTTDSPIQHNIQNIPRNLGNRVGNWVRILCVRLRALVYGKPCDAVYRTWAVILEPGKTSWKYKRKKPWFPDSSEWHRIYVVKKKCYDVFRPMSPQPPKQTALTRLPRARSHSSKRTRTLLPHIPATDPEGPGDPPTLFHTPQTNTGVRFICTNLLQSINGFILLVLITFTWSTGLHFFPPDQCFALTRLRDRTLMWL